MKIKSESKLNWFYSAGLTKKILIAVVLIWFCLLIVLPFFGIVKACFENGADKFFSALMVPEARHAFILTMIISIIAIAFNTVFGVILAIVLVRYRFRGTSFFEGLVDLPFAVSPVVAGFMLIILFGKDGWIGQFFEMHQIKIIYAFPGMVLATLFVTLPFVAREIIPVLKEFGIQQEEAAYILGASRWQTFWKVTLPSIKWGLVYGMTLTMARSIGEFGAVLVVSGNIIYKTQTSTLHIHQSFTDFNYAGALSGAIALAMISFLILTGMQFINERR